MATTTTEGTPSQPDGHPVNGLQPVPLHLCADWLDDDVSDELSRLELIDLDAVLSTDNVRSHAEVPEPDGFGLPSHDC
nr:hypothetical protein [Myxococcota bacterium]